MRDNAQKATAKKIKPYRKKGPLVTIDLDGKTIRAVETSPSGTGAKVEEVAVAQLDFGENPSPDVQATAAALKKSLAEAKVKTKAAVFTVPRSKVVLRPVIVPNVEDVRELASIVSFQISKDLPFRLEEAVVDFKVLRLLAPQAQDQKPASENIKGNEKAEAEPATAGERLEVLVGAIKTDVLEHYRKLAHGAGLKLAGLGLTSSGNLRVLKALGEIEGEGGLLLVSLRNEETTIEVIAHETLALSRVAAIAQLGTSEEGAEPVSTDKFISSLGTEVLRSLHSYEGMMWHEPATKILVCGGSGLESRVAEALQSRLGLTARVLEASDRLGLREPVDPGAFTAIGVALAAQEPAGLPIDFVTPKKPAAQTNNRRTHMLIAAAAALVLLFTLFGVRAHLVKKRDAIRASVQAQLASEEKKLPIYRKLKSQTKVVKAWADEEQNWLNHLAYLTGILPPADQLYVSSIATTSQKVIRMSVQAKTGELLAELDKKLRAAGYEVKPLSITPSNDKYGYNFRTTVELAVPKKLNIDLQKINPPKRPEDDVSRSASNYRRTTGGVAAR